MPYLLQAQPAGPCSTVIFPVFAVLQGCADEVGSVVTLNRPSLKEQADIDFTDNLSEK